MSQLSQPHIEVLTQRLLAAADTLRRMLSEHFAKFGLNETRFGVLKTLRSHGAEGCSQTALAQSLKLSESSVCGLVDRMQSDGLIYRFRSREDRRRSLLMLSERGAELADLVEAGRLDCVNQVLCRYSTAEQQVLCKLLFRMSDEASTSDQPPAFRREAG